MRRQYDRVEAEKFGAYVRKLRERRGLTVDEVAAKLNLSGPFYSRAERGIRDLRKQEIVGALANILSVPVEQLRHVAGLERLVNPAETAARIRSLAGELQGVRSPNKNLEVYCHGVGDALEGLAASLASLWQIWNVGEDTKRPKVDRKGPVVSRKVVKG